MFKFYQRLYLWSVWEKRCKNDIPGMACHWESSSTEQRQQSGSLYFSIATTDVEALSALYSGAFCYVQPSLYEGFGLPVIEALACETPVVSSNRGSLPEVLKKPRFSLEPTAEALAQTVLTVKDLSANQRKQQVAKGLTLSKFLFTWKKTAEKPLLCINRCSIYETTLSTRHLIAILAITNIYWLHVGLPLTHDGENHLALFCQL